MNFRNDKFFAALVCLNVAGAFFNAWMVSTEGDPMWWRVTMALTGVFFTTATVRSIWRDRA